MPQQPPRTPPARGARARCGSPARPGAATAAAMPILVHAAAAGSGTWHRAGETPEPRAAGDFPGGAHRAVDSASSVPSRCRPKLWPGGRGTGRVRSCHAPRSRRASPHPPGPTYSRAAICSLELPRAKSGRRSWMPAPLGTTWRAPDRRGAPGPGKAAFLSPQFGQGNACVPRGSRAPSWETPLYFFPRCAPVR